MKEILEFLKKSDIFYLATTEGDQPRVRPFGAVIGFAGKLYFVTSNQKDVYKQLKANPKVEICGTVAGDWMRITGELTEDDNRDARVAMLAEYPQLSMMYAPDDGKMTMLYFSSGSAVLYSFTKPPVSCEL